MKIHKLKIAGIQSHKNTELELSPGVNVLIGYSNYGKSALMKSLYWLAFNRPTQPKFIARDNTKEQRVDLITDSGNEITRRKTKSKNEYHLNGEVFKNVGTDVPQEIQQELMLCEVNFNRQGDPLFFLSKSPGERSRFLNDNVSDLYLIDTFTSEFNSEIREADKERERCKEQVEELQAELEKLQWVPKLRNKVQKLTKKQEKLESETENIETYNKELSEAQRIKNNLPDRKKLQSKLKKVRKLESKRQKFVESQEHIETLRNELEEAKKRKKKIDKTPRYTDNKRRKLNSLIKKADKIEKEEEKISELRDNLDTANNLSGKLSDKNDKIKELRKQYEEEFPEVCPWCGADWSK